MSKQTYKLLPEFRPMNVEVILDEGVKEMKGNFIRLPIIDIQYQADYMRIYVKDYKGRKQQ